MQGTQDGWVPVKSSEKMWSTEERNGNTLWYSCLENPLDSMRRQKDMTMEDEPPRLEGAHYATGKEQRTITNTPERKKWLGQSRNNAQLWMCLVGK